MPHWDHSSARPGEIVDEEKRVRVPQRTLDTRCDKEDAFVHVPRVHALLEVSRNDVSYELSSPPHLSCHRLPLPNSPPHWHSSLLAPQEPL